MSKNTIRKEFSTKLALPSSGQTWAILLLLLTVAVGCRSSGPGIAVGSGSDGRSYYARFAIQVDRNICRSTNYRNASSAVTLPVNTRVEFVSKRRYRFKMRSENGQDFMFEHIAKHTKDSAVEAFGSFFSAEPTDLSSFSAKERKAIEAGKVETGMSREAVLVTAGPPPAIGTLDLAGPVWKYWHNRWATFTVRFGEDGKVSEIIR